MDITDILSTLTDDLIDRGKLTKENQGSQYTSTIIYTIIY